MSGTGAMTGLTRRGALAVLGDPGVVARLGQTGIEVTPAGPEEFSAMMAAEAARWRTLLADPRVSIR